MKITVGIFRGGAMTQAIDIYKPRYIAVTLAQLQALNDNHL